MDVKVLGAGYGGLRAALDLDRRLGRERGVRITLIDKNDYHQLITELHKPAAGSSQVHRVAIPLAEILRPTRIRFTRGEVTAIRPAERALALRDGVAWRFDQLVVALGSDPEYFRIPGLEENSLTIHSVNSAQLIRKRIEEALRQGAAEQDPKRRRAWLTVAVAGGGFTGIEVAGELAERLPRLARRLGLDPGDVRIVTVEAAPDLLPGFEEPLVESVTETLLERGVSLVTGVPIVRVEPGGLVLEDGQRIAAQTIVWCGGVRGNALVERSFTTQGRGRAVVNRYLQSVDSPDVYCVGDCALAVNPRSGRPLPPMAHHALAQGRIAAYNIWARWAGRPLLAYKALPMAVVATVGPGRGIARLGRLRLAGTAPAVLKDAITLRYVYSLGGPRLVLRFLLGARARQARSGSQPSAP